MRRVAILFGVLLTLMLVPAAWASRGVISITGIEQQNSAGLYDSGSFTVSINGYSETVSYGRYSTNASLASAIAAKLSQDCSSPVLAHAHGSTITLVTRDPSAAISPVTASLVWDSSNFTAATAATFALNTPTSQPPSFTPTVSCVPSVVISGGNVTCAVTLLAGATSPVNFSIGGNSWGSAATPNSLGIAVANAALTEATPGSYAIAYNYPGDPAQGIPSASGSATVAVEATGSATPGTQAYSFSITSASNGSGYAANGNITDYTDTVNGTWRLGYDGLDRLTSATLTPASGSAKYVCWGYDAFGNMLTQATATQPISGNGSSCPAQPGSVIAQSSLVYGTDGTNRMTPASSWKDVENNNVTATYSSPQYDATGDLISAAASTTNGTFTQHFLYDSEGRICAVQNGGTITGYLYDAEGHRVAKATLPSLTCDPGAFQQSQVSSTYFIGPDGEAMTEIDGNGFWVRTEVSAAGQYLATYTPDGIHYPLTDWLGTKRKQVNPNLGMNNGVEETCTSFPFGDQLYCGSTLDASPRHFTAKERDSESGLDYFGARYYASSAGRWMSPDWSAQVAPIPYANLGDPQSLNLYQYVRNNPVHSIDADGHIGLDGGYVDALTGLLGSEEANETREEQNDEDRDRASASSSNTGRWHRFVQHLGNLVHLHSWNYEMRTRVWHTLSIPDEPNENTSLGVDVAGGVVTAAAPRLDFLGKPLAAFSLWNDHGPGNVGLTAMGLTGDATLAGAGASVPLVWDGGLIVGHFTTDHVMAPMIDSLPPQTIEGPYGQMPNPALFDETDIPPPN